MKRLFTFILLILFALSAKAHHIIGGEMYYVFVSKSSTNYTYNVTLKLYRGCEPVDNNHSALDPSVTFSIWNNDDNSLVATAGPAPLQGPTFPGKQNTDPCITNPPNICYQVGTYTAQVTLPVNKTGYTVSFQRCCRDNLLLNVNTAGDVGATYFTIIPGSQTGIPGTSSPVFTKEEAVLICKRGKIQYFDTASDSNGDSLVYSFAPGFIGGSGAQTVPVPTSPPPFQTFSYQNGFTAYDPLGPGVTINSKTGEITGRTDLTPGTYDVSVAVQAYNNGKLIATHHKDYQFTVYDCERTVLADIPPLFNDCKSFTINFPDNSTTGKTYLWNFGDGDTSTAYTPAHTYADTGTYNLWLKVDPTSSCGDSIGAVAKIYPGLNTNFSHSGNCLQFPTGFQNLSSLNKNYDSINALQWNFGVPGNFTDTSSQENPSYHYSSPAIYPVTLTVMTEKGCEQTDTQSLNIYDKPPISLSPGDTDMCYKDQLQLNASSTLGGSYSWQPAYNIIGQNAASPTVYPRTDTTYYVTFTDNEKCVNTDSVHLRVKNKLLINAGNDTTICKGDPVFLNGTSNDQYAITWYDNAHQVVAKTLQAQTVPTQNETYTLEATLGTCIADTFMNTRVVPYPVPYAAPDTTICYGDKIQLRGGGGSFYQWFPGSSLSDSIIASPIASPKDTTIYTLTVTDTLGCPKPVDTSVLVGVIPPVPAFAGNDTIITTGQTFQLQATGGNKYLWSPATGLSDPNIPNPLVTGNKDVEYVVKVSIEPEGCYAYDSLHVRYIIGPDIYVPTAFTPNGDGMNDIFRPIPVGIRRIDYFRVYNRWGQLVFQTTQYMKGWNGTFNGKPCDEGGYVWMVKGEDYEGHSIVKKGMVLLIR